MIHGEHPDEILTASYLDGDLAGPIRDRIEGHLAVCAACRAGVSVLALARASAGGAIDDPDLPRFREAALAVGSPSRRARRRSFPILAAAAVVLVAALVSVWLRNAGPAPPAPIERTGSAERGLAALAPERGARIPCRDLVFRFGAFAGADRYVIEVADGEGRTLAEIESRQGAEPVPWPHDRPIPRGTVLWSVRAMALDRVLAETRPVPFVCE